MTRTMTAAGNKAKGLVGKRTTIPPGHGMCLAECVRTIYGWNGPFRWGGNGRAWAINYWFAAVKYGKVVKTSDPAKVPFGALLFFDSSGNKPEHVAIGAGNGYCYSTDWPRGRWGKVKISSLSSSWRLELVGYILVTGDPKPQDLRDKKADPKDPASYYMGATGDYITTLGKNCVRHGFGKHFKEGPGPVFGEADRLNIVDVQHHLGFKGDDADGYPGESSLAFLAGPVVKVQAQTTNPNLQDQDMP